MSILDRIDSIHESLVTTKFSKARDAFLALENPTKQQIDTFERTLKEVEEKQKARDDLEAEIVKHWKMYQSIINDPQYPKDSPTKLMVRSLTKLEKGFADFEIDGDTIIKGKINKGVLSDIKSEPLVRAWELFKKSGEKKKPATAEKKRERSAAPAPKKKRENAASLKASLDRLIKDPDFTIIIGLNPEVSAKVDELNALLGSGGDDLSAESLLVAKAGIKFLQSFGPKSPTCEGENCSASNTPLKDGLCIACLLEKVEKDHSEITDRFGVFKEEQMQLVSQRKIDKTEKEAHKTRLNDVSTIKSEFDDACGLFEETNGKKGYETIMGLYEKLNEILPIERNGKKKRFIEPDEIIKSDESEAESSESDEEEAGGKRGESEYEEDSSSSHSGSKRVRKDEGGGGGGGGKLLEAVLDTFAPLHPEIKRLAAVYKDNRSNFAKELEETKNNRLTRFKVVAIDNKKEKKPVFPIPFPEPTIFFTEEDAIARGEEVCKQMGEDPYVWYRVEKL